MTEHDDNEDFASAMAGVRPLTKPVKRVHRAPPVKATPGQSVRKQDAQIAKATADNPLNVSHLQMVKPDDSLRYLKPGLDRSVLRKLKQGAYQVEASLDLHGKTVEQARNALLRFVQDCFRFDVRLAIVLHGKGEQGDPPALLKSFCNRWLREIPEVLAFMSAPSHHGGAGAAYVLIKKRDAKAVEQPR
jgi:DNA-nicking Smr family endonuclease